MTRLIRQFVRLVLLAVAGVVFGVVRFATARIRPPRTLTRATWKQIVAWIDAATGHPNST